MGRRWNAARVAATGLLAAALAVGLLAVPGRADPDPTLTLSPTSGQSGSLTQVDGTGFRGVGSVSITVSGVPAGTTTAEPSGKLVAVDITVNGVGPVEVRGCQDDGAGDLCGYTASATFTATAPPTTSTTTTTTTSTTTTTTTSPPPSTSTTTTSSSTTTTTTPGPSTTTTTAGPPTTTTTSPGTPTTTTTTAGSTSTTQPGSTSTTAPGTPTTSTTVAAGAGAPSTTTTTGSPPELEAPEGTTSDPGAASAGQAREADDTESDIARIKDDDDRAVVAAERISAGVEHTAMAPTLIAATAIWFVMIGLWLLMRNQG